MAETLDTGEWFFDRPFSPPGWDLLADGLVEWLRADALRDLVLEVPGRRRPEGPIESLAWPPALGGPVPRGRQGLAQVLDSLAEICDWSRPGTVWDYRVGGGERRRDDDAPPQPGLAAAGVAAGAAALGLRSPGRLRHTPRTVVVLGGRNLAPLNRARAAAAAITARPGPATRVVLLCARRDLEPAERRNPGIRRYAPDARSEADLIAAAGRATLGATERRVLEVPGVARSRASTYETLCALAGELTPEDRPVALFTSPTCRPFQYLDAARALGLGAGLEFELAAHPPAWAADPRLPTRPHVYLQEVRGVVQAAARLAAALAASDRPPDAQPALAV